MNLLIFVTLLLPLLYLLLSQPQLTSEVGTIRFFLNEEKSGSNKYFSLKKMNLFVYSYKEKE